MPSRKDVGVKRKYRNKPTKVDGITFHSKKEAKRYGELKLLQRAGEIHDLELQPPFVIQVNGMKVCKYVADFSYWEPIKGHNKTGPFRQIIEDTKGVLTPAYRLKKKLMLAVHGIEIRET